MVPPAPGQECDLTLFRTRSEVIATPLPLLDLPKRNRNTDSHIIERFLFLLLQFFEIAVRRECYDISSSVGNVLLVNGIDTHLDQHRAEMKT
jgi:hypothetical protein